MPDKTKISTTHAAQTTKINNGNVAVKQVIVKKPPKPLFVLFAYEVDGDKSFLYAAEFKKERLQKKYPNGKVLPIIGGFKYPSQFKKKWSELYKYLTESDEIVNKYSLWEVHYFGHGGPESFYLKPEGGIKGENSEIFFNKSDNMARLPWHPNKGIFVLHSCRGAAFEDTEDKNKIANQICLAKTISKKQETRCLGQVTYANFAIDALEATLNNPENPAITPPKIVTTAEQDVIRFKYRYPSLINSRNESMAKNRVLWGYAFGFSTSWVKMRINKKKYEQIMERPYPISEELKKLSSIIGDQILPCRVFNKGVLEKGRIVKAGYFNNNDLEYI